MDKVNLLAFDTSDAYLKLAVYIDGKTSALSVDNNSRHIESLVPSVKKALEETGGSADKIRKILVCVGPGSFTGIRIGISTAEAFGYSLKKEVYGFSVFDVYNYLYKNVSEDAIAIPIIDAKKNRFYCAFLNGRSNYKIFDIPKEEIINIILKDFGDKRIIFAGKDFKTIEAYVSSAGIRYNYSHKESYSEFDMLDFAFYFLREGELKKPDPIYLRKSEAEIALLNRNLAMKN
ncbi:MAG TPA: tRNA (adenosine(37)-N6)-threonylcarbamoyltransferase complex dimerization subunit type 1 TsaB [Spirochaetota bacterium]|nr:tRNA (adenosine(37)-N6)-threonylcarbamoyltransferase complex dimerization subunit type 1 TsaB [Spirochaetota bacterium]HOS55093.1 tRNA (adenosine(37)-N6)-threonylcarbamoyltransferase complex dimerization subunit type 1 TsaB [Spirochaetota bacterium]HQF77600.1 tRNA (adenosine(37)-N6)-threonylcarbamoyltransferase complex dimerization subunit type 1 TsaB [Spirochaetota bacterium]HQH31455.1 tRNA (adenosine(37)-N6)-threonylcarbamoyltransferase complex dimerization subunit type 1 TsaB [Spirochaetot